MNKLGLTHIESLDSDTVTIPGLDVDAALANTIALGKKKIRRHAYVRIMGGAAMLLVITLSAFGIVRFFDDTSGNVSRVATTDKTKTVSKVAATTIAPVTQPDVVTTTPPALTTQSRWTQGIDSRFYGDRSVCTPPPGINEPDPATGVAIGTSVSEEKWTPQPGETKTVSVNGRNVVLKNVVENGSSSVKFQSGLGRANTFGEEYVSGGVTYCESGFNLQAGPIISEPGYIIRTEGW
ncbi:MAG TPA: hypothetical protein PKB15_05855 [Acidimicrobiia bacterium]|nr:hypothetical protein [Acidimicrobiia bacterium]